MEDYYEIKVRHSEEYNNWEWRILFMGFEMPWGGVEETRELALHEGQVAMDSFAALEARSATYGEWESA